MRFTRRVGGVAGIAIAVRMILTRILCLAFVRGIATARIAAARRIAAIVYGCCVGEVAFAAYVVCTAAVVAVCARVAAVIQCCIPIIRTPIPVRCYVCLRAIAGIAFSGYVCVGRAVG
mmetsp:Transcript_41906/g.97596  ORF Transcript_41906/g.97596 Transcript_41906/m.97596 type:complete len:118 (+) Transcript_41906:540-893(+)